jgi:hypothetical protein
METKINMSYYNAPNVEAYNSLYEECAMKIISASDFEKADAICNEFIVSVNTLPQRYFSNISIMDDLYRLSLKTNLLKLLLQTHPMSLPF